MKKITFFLLFISIVTNVFSQLEYKDVAGIFYNRCASCHHTNGGAPFSLMNYSETVAETSTIQNALILNLMPPWPADTTYKRYVGEHIITQSEKNAILSWISTGALQGDTTLAPTAPSYSQYKLSGTPDLILKIPVFASNASATTDAYDIFALPTGLTSTRTIRAIEVVAGNPGIVHHVVVMGDGTGTGTSDLSGNAFTVSGNIGISGFQPGANPVVFPNSSILKMGIDLPAGSKIMLQIHYPAGSSGMLDSTQVRIYFYPSATPAIRQVYIMANLQYWGSDFWLAPETIKTFEQDTAEWDTFPVSIFSALPHSHKICSSVLNYAYNTSTLDTIPLIRINDWEFHWQYYYYYKNLVKIPPGYRYHAKHTYDNTSSNPDNPYSPPQLIFAGANSNNEMLFDTFQWMVYYPGDELINIDSLLTTDPLLTASINEPISSSAWIYSFVYPNPFSQQTTIQIVSNKNTLEEYQLVLFDVTGRKIHPSVEKKENAFEINRSGLSSGIYFYQIISNTKVVSEGKIIVQ